MIQNNLESIVRDVKDSIKNNTLDWAKYYQYTPEIYNNIVQNIKNRTINTTHFIKNYFLSKEMQKKRKEHTIKLYKELRKKGYSNRTSKYVSKLTPLPVEDTYGQDFFSGTLGLIVGRMHEPIEKMISKYSGIPLEKIERGTYWMEYINNIFSGGQIALSTVVFINGTYALFTNEGLSIKNNLLITTVTYLTKYMHTLIDHIHYEKTGEYRTNHAMILVPLSWPAYTIGLAMSTTQKINNNLNNKKTSNS